MDSQIHAGKQNVGGGLIGIGCSWGEKAIASAYPGMRLSVDDFCKT
jgi:hypothetical protein